MTERSIASLAVDEALADGTWHDVAEVVTAVAAKVPPGVAHRVGEARRQRALSMRGTPVDQPRRNGSSDQGRLAGARAVAWDALKHRIRDGAAERQGARVRRSQP